MFSTNKKLTVITVIHFWIHLSSWALVSKLRSSLLYTKICTLWISLCPSFFFLLFNSKHVHWQDGTWEIMSARFGVKLHDLDPLENWDFICTDNRYRQLVTFNRVAHLALKSFLTITLPSNMAGRIRWQKVEVTGHIESIMTKEKMNTVAQLVFCFV